METAEKMESSAREQGRQDGMATTTKRDPVAVYCGNRGIAKKELEARLAL